MRKQHISYKGMEISPEHVLPIELYLRLIEDCIGGLIDQICVEDCEEKKMVEHEQSIWQPKEE